VNKSPKSVTHALRNARSITKAQVCEQLAQDCLPGSGSDSIQTWANWVASPAS